MNDTLPVLHLINGEHYAGAERVQDLLALRLPVQGYELSFASLKDGVFAAKRMAQSTPLHSFPMRSNWDLRQAFRIARLVRRGGFRLLHTHSPRGALVGHVAALITGVPMLHHVHSPTLEDTEAGWRNWRNSTVEKLSLVNSRRLIPVSGSLEHYLIKRGYSAKRIRKVWNGVPVQPLARRALRAGETLVIGSVALFRPRKGLEVLLKAMAAVKQSGQAVRLHAVGSFETPDYQTQIRRLVGELGLQADIHWSGFCNDVAGEFPHMHAFVLPSLYGEGLPMVVLEAMAAGLPVISTRVEGIPEVLRDGQEGFLLPPGDVAALADCLRRVASGAIDLAAIGDRGRQRQQHCFSDHAMARAVAAIYDEVIATVRTSEAES